MVAAQQNRLGLCLPASVWFFDGAPEGGVGSARKAREQLFSLIRQIRWRERVDGLAAEHVGVDRSHPLEHTPLSSATASARLMRRTNRVMRSASPLTVSL
jgi:hypothetical protein